MKKLLKNKNIRFILTTAFVLVFVSVFYFLGFFNFVEYKIYDKLISSTAKSKGASEEIIVVLLDQSSIDWAKKEKGWNWPWPRKAYGDIAKYFSLGDANCLCYDVLYTENSVYSEEDDYYFAKSCNEADNVIFALDFGKNYGSQSKWKDGIRPSNTKISGYSNDFLNKMGNQNPLFPVDIIAQSAKAFGQVSSITDSDGIIRKTKVFRLLDNIAVPCLGFAPLSLDTEPLEFSLNKKNMILTMKEKSFQIDKNNSAYLRFRGEIESYAPYRAKDILESYYAILNNEEPLLNPKDFKNKYVFFGFNAPGLFDIAPTPINTKYPGVGIHITTLDNFLQNDFIYKIPNYIAFILFFICSFFGVFIYRFVEYYQKSHKFNLLFSLLFIFLYSSIFTLIARYIFIWKYWLPIFSCLFTTILAYIITILLNFYFEGKERRYLKIAFKHYLSPSVIEQIISDPSKLKLGGERKKISMFFSDLQGFTSISEKMSPENLTSLLNEYLTAMSNIILESGGTIDKYVGDAIVAFWNAPLSQENHGLQALNAAMKCQKTLNEMQNKIYEKTGHKLYMRIGLNTGEAIVGNLGSLQRFDYTILGDSVNLTSRLEGLNKQFGTYTLCTKALIENAQNHNYYMRELARVAVVGKTNAVTVFEPIELDYYNNHKDIFEKFDLGRNYFYEGDINKALEIFSELQDYDIPSKYYTDKCQSLINNPSSLKDFKGIWFATSK